jgi:hypothetical protein
MVYLPLLFCIIWLQLLYHLYTQLVRKRKVTYLPYILNRYDKLLARYFPSYSLCFIKHSSQIRNVFLQLLQLFVHFFPPKCFAMDGILVFEHLSYHELFWATENVRNMLIHWIHVDIEFSTIRHVDVLISVLGCIPMLIHFASNSKNTRNNRIL